MSGSNALLEDFDGSGGSARVPQARAPGADAIEAARLAGYEDGYKSGWADAVKSTEDSGETLGTELARNLKDMNFTYFDARDELLAQIEPFLRDLLDALFPKLLGHSAASAIASEISDTIGASLDGRILLKVSREDLETVRDLLSDIDALQAEIVESPELAGGQARISAGGGEIAVDAERLVERLRSALSDASAAAPEKGDVYG